MVKPFASACLSCLREKSLLDETAVDKLTLTVRAHTATGAVRTNCKLRGFRREGG